MIALPPEQRRALADAVDAAARRPEVRASVDALYAALQEAIDLRRPICRASGRCCRFEQFGHSLFVTTMELAAFRAAVEPVAAWDGFGCPYQAQGLCGVHAARPFGCRVFFCDETSTQWQQDQYARLHARLQREHERLGVAYFYVEWRQGLIAAGLAATPAGGVAGAQGPL